jgi:electron transfer flavoprotein beta subunit
LCAKAKKKPLDVATASSLGVDLAPSQQVLSVAEPPPRKGGGTVPDVDGLVAALKKTGLVK